MQLPRAMKTYQLSFMPAKSKAYLWAQVGVLKAWPGSGLKLMADTLEENRKQDSRPIETERQADIC